MKIDTFRTTQLFEIIASKIVICTCEETNVNAKLIRMSDQMLLSPSFELPWILPEIGFNNKNFLQKAKSFNFSFFKTV
jgi:hypothetical protein